MSTALINRRRFLAASGSLLAAPFAIAAAENGQDPIIDIHQHTQYSGRSNEQLVRHQERLGVTLTVLLPAGSMYGLDAGCGSNQTVQDLAREFPDRFVYFANEIPDLPGAVSDIRRHLRAGAIGIGEQKFRVPCDSRPIEAIAELAQEFSVPVLMHFQHNAYNTGIERFHRILEKYPRVNFIGHAQTWWGNIDARHDQGVMYPTGSVTPGGITDRLLAEYPNMFGDLSAGSGLNALRRDEAHTREFLDRHRNKLLYGSDCNDAVGAGNACQGAQILETLRRLAPDRAALRRIFYENAAGVLGLKRDSARPEPAR